MEISQLIMMSIPNILAVTQDEVMAVEFMQVSHSVGVIVGS